MVVSRRFALSIAALLSFTLPIIPILAATTASVAAKPKPKAPVHANAAKATANHTKAPATLAKKAVGNVNSFIPFYNAGITDYHAGRAADAEKKLKQALKLVQQFNPPNSVNQLYVNQMLGASIFKELETQPERLAEPLPYLNKALVLLSKPLKDAPANTKGLEGIRLSMLSMRGRIEMLQGHYAEAEQDIRTALPIAEANTGADGEQAKALRSTLADIGKISNEADYLDAMHLKRVSHWVKAAGESISVWIDDGSALSGWTPAYTKAVQEAYQDWQSSLHNNVQFSWAKSPEEADTIVHWSPTVMSASESGIVGESSELLNGYCRTRVSDRYYVRQEIKLSITDRSKKPSLPASIHSYALHEIGHSLGLDGGHSSNPGDIMFPSNSYDNRLWRKLSARDIATVQHLYTLKAQVSNPPGINLERYNEFFGLYQQGGEAYNAHNYTLAETFFQNALNIYNIDVTVHYLIGRSQVELKKYDAALPHLIYAANTDNKDQGVAIQMVAYTTLESAQMDIQAGRQDAAQQKMMGLQPFLTRHLATTAMLEEQRIACQKMLNGVNQTLANGINSAVVANSSPETTDTPVKRKGFFRFLEPIPKGAYYTNTNQLPYNLPGSMRGW